MFFYNWMHFNWFGGLSGATFKLEPPLAIIEMRFHRSYTVDRHVRVGLESFLVAVSCEKESEQQQGWFSPRFKKVFSPNQSIIVANAITFNFFMHFFSMSLWQRLSIFQLLFLLTGSSPERLPESSVLCLWNNNVWLNKSCNERPWSCCNTTPCLIFANTYKVLFCKSDKCSQPTPPNLLVFTSKVPCGTAGLKAESDRPAEVQ